MYKGIRNTNFPLITQLTYASITSASLDTVATEWIIIERNYKKEVKKTRMITVWQDEQAGLVYPLYVHATINRTKSI